MNVLVAGGAGYIGSHTVKLLKQAGHSPIIYDNGSRGHPVVAEILGVPAVIADLNDRKTLVQTLRDRKIWVLVGSLRGCLLRHQWRANKDTQQACEHTRGFGLHFVSSRAKITGRTANAGLQI